MAMGLALAGVRWPESLDTWLLWLLPVPVVVEWWVEHHDLARYSAWRNVAFSLLCAPAVGVGLARYMRDPGDGLFWWVVGVYALVCLAPVVIGHRRRSAANRAPRSPKAAGPAS